MSYSNHSTGWPYHSNSQHQSSSNQPPLREPVAFEDFQFSLGLDPDFSMPVPLDMMPPPAQPMADTDFFNSMTQPPPPPQQTNSFQTMSVLDEQDHKAFDQFLDQFYVDPNMQIDPQLMYPMSSYLPNTNEETEYHRQSSILQSLDEHHRRFGVEHKHQTHNMTPCVPDSLPMTTNNYPNNHSNNNGGGGGGAIRRTKPHKELLTEEEKRNNHIASEKKRRSMIRSGFKDLTEIVPTLKNINNSKSTVLFKAVDFIRYLDKRNRNLREKIKHLKVRVEVEGRMSVLNHPPSLRDKPPMSLPPPPPSSSSSSSLPPIISSPYNSIHNTSSTSIPPAPFQQTQAALLQHKTQQKQLMELQEKLQLHQKALAQKTHTFRFEKPQTKEREIAANNSKSNTNSAELLACLQS